MGTEGRNHDCLIELLESLSSERLGRWLGMALILAPLSRTYGEDRAF